MPKLYKNPKLVVPVLVMAVLAALTLVTVRYLNAMIDIVLSPRDFGGMQDPFFSTYIAEIIGRLGFPFFALVTVILLFTSRSKVLLGLFFGLTAFFGLVPALYVSIDLAFFQGWGFGMGFFWVNDWWTGTFDLGLAVYHLASWLVAPVAILYLILSLLKGKAPASFPAPAAPAAQNIIGYDTTTGAPIYGDSK